MNTAKVVQRHGHSPRLGPWLAVLALMLASVVFYLCAGAEQRLLVPIVAIPIICAVAVFVFLWSLDRALPVVDAGMMCIVATAIYTIYPVINFWQGNMSFATGDIRLAAYELTPSELAKFHLQHLVYIVVLSICYILFRGKLPRPRVVTQEPSHSAKVLIVGMGVMTFLVLMLMRFGAGVSVVNVSYEGSNLADNVAALAALPLVVRQVIFKWVSLTFFLKLILLYVAILRYKWSGWRIFLWTWLAFEIFLAFYIKGSRTELIFIILAALMFYHSAVEALTWRVALLFALSVFAVFMFLGAYREEQSFHETVTAFSAGNSGLTRTNEFQALLGTEYDVYRRTEIGGGLPLGLYFNDIMPILPPQQILPFAKLTGDEWYLRELNLENSGIGYMWGVVTQAEIGGGVVELVLRGCVLAWVLARIRRWYIARARYALAEIIYVYIALRTYYTFRETTGSLLVDFIWVILPVVAIFHFVSPEFVDPLFKKRPLGAIRPMRAGPAKRL